MGIPAMVGRAILGHVLEKPVQKGIVKMLGGNPAFVDMKPTGKQEPAEDEPDKQTAPEDDRNAYKKGGKVNSWICEQYAGRSQSASPDQPFQKLLRLCR